MGCEIKCHNACPVATSNEIRLGGCTISIVNDGNHPGFPGLKVPEDATICDEFRQSILDFTAKGVGKTVLMTCPYAMQGDVRISRENKK